MTTLTNAQVSFLLSNLVGNNTYVIFDYYVVPGNRFQFGGITDTLNDDSIANYTKGSHAIYDINADVYDKNAERAFTVFQDNGVDLAEYTYLMISTLDGESTYILLWGDITYDIHFNDENNSNNKGFEQTFEYCKNYIEQSNGTGESYFESYKNGTASIVCNETSEVMYETAIISPTEAKILSAMKTLIRDNEPITTEPYSGSNPYAFSEFAETNGFDLDEVVSVYTRHEDNLQELWDEYNN